ncbi:hypothetical protein [Bacteriovorax sp. DB6_IX]|uniref:hypothetical protein n=1 Tax=Bacteriovorax sp. DB6_IX TaxID=1353530 RepID=UPI00038A49E6|nr:hypothetical protein [Bacteriovorax sp. DB6_IX]EQC51698.1 hypothetical protein M901_0286 [Bacteriovorax sp. DB6_IX]
MKIAKWICLLFLTTNILAGGDYGGGPQIVQINKIDHSIKLADIKLSRDKKDVEVILTYQRRVLKFDPFLGEKDAQKLKYGKYAEKRVSYDKNLFSQDLINKLNKRSVFTIFKSKYRKLVQENFTLEEVTEQMNLDEEKRAFEVNLK